MCVSLRPAAFSSTIVYAHATVFRGRPVHVLGYQNTARSKIAGPNAMILPIPARVAMGPGNAIDTREFASVLKDYAESLNRIGIGPPIFRAVAAAAKPTPRVQVFERGSYAIVLASDASTGAIRAAMESPGLDAHDGGVPDLDARVKLDHAVVVGVGSESHGVSARLPTGVPSEIQPLLAAWIAGWGRLRGRCRNGDWWIRLDAMKRELDPHVRRPPPGARVTSA